MTPSAEAAGVTTGSTAGNVRTLPVRIKKELIGRQNEAGG